MSSIKTFLAIAILFLSFARNTIAQNPTIILQLDSVLRSNPPDTTKILMLSLLCYHLSATNSDTSRKLGMQGLELAQKLGNEKFIGICESNLGFMEFRQGNYEAAKKLMLSALDKFKKAKLESEILSVTQNLSLVAMRESDYPKAFTYCEEVLEISEKMKDQEKIGQAYQNFAPFYRAQGNFGEAEKYLRRALSIFEKEGMSELIFDCYNSLGNLRFETKDFEAAITFYKKGIAIGLKAGNQHQLGLSYENLALSLSSLHHYDEAFQWFEKAKQILQELGEQNELTYLSLSIGSVYHEMGDSQNAQIALHQALSMAIDNHYTDLEAMILDELEKLSTDNKDYKQAYEFKQRSQVLSDSLHQSERKNDLEQLQSKFETAQKEKELHIKTLETQRLQTFISFGSLALLLSVFFAIGFWKQARFRKHTNENLLIKNEEVQAACQRAEESEFIKQQFLANMSHEIRTPLHALIGISNLLAQTPAKDEKTNSYHQILQKSSENLMFIVNEILDFSKLEAGKMQLDHSPFNLQELLNNNREMFQSKADDKNIQLQVEFLGGNAKWLIGDAHRLTQVLSNLLSNAIKFTEKGSVHLIAEQLNQEIIRFSVIDSGIGIPPEKWTEIFVSFVQSETSFKRQFGGTGLGLTISKNLVELMGGILKVESSPGLGSKFWFEISLPESKQVPSKFTNEHTDQFPIVQLSTPIKVLLAEDNVYNQVVAADSLTALHPDFQVTVASNGQEALSMLNSKSFDLLLLDIQMPLIDGFELTRIIRSHVDPAIRQLPIIALTASAGYIDIMSCLQSGMNGFAPKPFRLRELALEIERVLQDKLKIISNEKDIDHPATVTNLSELKKLTADLPGHKEKMIQILIESLSEKIGLMELELNKQDKKAYAKIVHSIRPLTISAGMENMQNVLIDLETKCDEMAIEDWNNKSRYLNKAVRNAIQELKRVV